LVKEIVGNTRKAVGIGRACSTWSLAELAYTSFIEESTDAI
jgi:hypothetical protein